MELIPTTPFELLVYVVLAAIGGIGIAWTYWTRRVSQQDSAATEADVRDASDKRHEGFYELIQRQYDVTTQQHNAALVVIKENTASNVRLCGALDNLGTHLSAQGDAIREIQTRTLRIETQQQHVLAHLIGRTPGRQTDQEAPA